MAKSDISTDAKTLMSTWAMMRKAIGVLCACLNACGYKQVERLQFDNDILAPVVCDMTVCIVLMLAVLAG